MSLPSGRRRMNHGKFEDERPIEPLMLEIERYHRMRVESLLEKALQHGDDEVTVIDPWGMRHVYDLRKYREKMSDDALRNAEE